MKKFIVNLFSNRFGIILAALNLCYFASRTHDFNAPPYGKLFVNANFPSLGSTILALDFIKTFVYKFSPSAEAVLGDVFFAVFIIFQWLFIAWIAKTLNSLPQIAKLHSSRR